MIFLLNNIFKILSEAKESTDLAMRFLLITISGIPSL